MTTQEYLVCQIRTIRPIVRHLLEMRSISEDAISARGGDLELWYKAQRVAFDSSYLTARMHLTTAQEILRRMHNVKSGRMV